jgi:hypothetical protein
MTSNYETAVPGMGHKMNIQCSGCDGSGISVCPRPGPVEPDGLSVTPHAGCPFDYICCHTDVVATAEEDGIGVMIRRQGFECASAACELVDRQVVYGGEGGQECPGGDAVAYGGGASAFGVVARADLFGDFGFDQFLHDHSDRFTDRIDSFSGTECVEQFGQGRLGQGHRWTSFFDACLAVHTADPADGPHYVGAAPFGPNPITSRDTYHPV